MLKSLLALALTFVFSAAPVAGAQGGLTEESVGGKWRDGSLPPLPMVMYLADGVITGNDGCNSFMGDYLLKEDHIVLQNMGITRAACPDVASHPTYQGLQQWFQNSADTTVTMWRNGAGMTLAIPCEDGSVVNEKTGEQYCTVSFWKTGSKKSVQQDREKTL